MSADLIHYIEGLHARLTRDYSEAHEKLEGFEARDQAEFDSLLRHVDHVARQMLERRAAVLGHVADRLGLPAQVPPSIEDRYSKPKIARVA